MIAFFFPTAYFKSIPNPSWNHEITTWIFGYFIDIRNEIITYGFYTNLLILIPSSIFSSIILISLLVISINFFLKRKYLEKGSILNTILAMIMIISVFFWMMMMEIAEQEIYNLSFWNRFTICFGVTRSLIP